MRRSHAAARAALVLSVIVTDGALAAQVFTATDSAGVTIATSTAPAWAPGEEWTLSETPVIRLGGALGDGADLWQVRDFLRTPDGGVAVLSFGHREVRLFDGDGRFVRAIGRQGQGPGELEWPMSLALATPDTLLVLDRGAIEIFVLDGTAVESVPARAVPNAFGPGRTASPRHVVADRSIVGVVSGGFNPGAGPFRPPQGLVYFPGAGRPPVLAGEYGGGLQELVDLGGGQREVVMPPFARFTVLGVGPSSGAKFFAADIAVYEIHVFDAEGSLRRVVRRDHEPVPAEDEWIEDWKEKSRERIDGRFLPAKERAWSRMTVPETLPAFDAVAFDSGGHLWVARPTPSAATPLVYDVFDPDGRYLGEVDAPRGVEGEIPPRIGLDYFMALQVGGLGVEQVAVYDLHRDAGDRR